jgi:hypothetical protein
VGSAVAGAAHADEPLCFVLLIDREPAGAPSYGAPAFFMTAAAVSHIAALVMKGGCSRVRSVPAETVSGILDTRTRPDCFV